MRFAPVLSAVGYALLSLTLAGGFSMLVAIGYEEFEQWPTFFITSTMTAFIGVGLILATKGNVGKAGRSEAFMLAAMIWLVLPVFGALPLYYGGINLTPVDAYFEAVSGLTTTGATTIVGLDLLPHSILFWRAILQWLGGFATILLATGLLSLLGVGGMQLHYSAMPRSEKDTLNRRLARTAQLISVSYGGLTLLCGMSLWMAGMPAFDAMCHAMSTLSTGGFSTRDSSIAAFDTPMIELILMIFMVVGALNFTLHWALSQGRVMAYVDDPEARYYIILLAVTIAVVSLSLIYLADFRWTTGLRQGAFLTISSLTTTGFALANTSHVVHWDWPLFVTIFLVGLVMIGGCTGSTAGGLKLMRVSLMLKHSWRELARLCYPNSIVRIRYGEGAVKDPVIHAAWTYFILFVLMVALVIILLAAFGLPFEHLIMTAVSVMSNAGPAVVVLSGGEADYALWAAGPKVVMAFGMILGRLEILVFLALVSPRLWQK